MRSLIVTALLLGCLSGIVARAEDCRWEDGGYCVAAIAEQTTKKLGWGEVVAPNGGVGYLNYYEALWGRLVKEEKGTLQEHEKLFEEARQAGGTKIGGVNLVVLAAGTLQKLVDLKLLTLEQAQGILDGARSLPATRR